MSNSINSQRFPLCVRLKKGYVETQSLTSNRLVHPVEHRLSGIL